MSLTTAPIKVKITREDGTSELRRLGFSFDNSMVSRGRFGQQLQAEGYHLALCKFLLRSLQDLYPDLPVSQFSELVVFTVKDEDGDMVRFDSEEEFVAALPGYESWKACLRIEATVLKPVPTPSPRNPTSTSTPPPVRDHSATIATTLGSIGMLPTVSTASFVRGEGEAGVGPTPSESGSTISFVSNMSSVFPGSGSASSTSLSTAAVAEAAAAEPANREGPSAPPCASGTGPENTTAATGPSGSYTDSANAVEGIPTAAPAGGNGTGPDAATPAKAFLSQVLPGLADVLARSIYAAQWAPEMIPNPSSTQAQEQGTSQWQAQGTSPGQAQGTSTGQAQGTSPGQAQWRREGADSSRVDPNPLNSAVEGLTAMAAAVAAASGAFGGSPVRTTPDAPPVSNPAAAAPADAAATAASAAATAAGAAASKAATDAAAATAAATRAAAAAAEAAAFPSSVSANLTGDGTSGEAAASPAGESDAPIAVHVGVVCDVCDMSPIMGTRYKCAVRSDFDLCEGCERSAGSASPFPYLKIRTPAQAPAAIVCLLKADQPRNVKEANAQAKKKGARGDGLAGKSYAACQAWRARRDPQHGGWGEGRRNTARWMRDVARHQHHQQQIGGAPSSGIGCFPAGVEVVRNSAAPAWRGPRMQRRNAAMTSTSSTAAGGKEPEQPPPAKMEAARESETQEGSEEDSASAAPATVATGATELDSACVGAAAATAERSENAPENTAPVDPTTNATTATVSTLMESEVEGGQPSDYQDMLAASMRSLASSMTTSLPASSGAQDGIGKTKGGVTTAGDGGKPQAKPMARFVTDVSVADGSPLPPNTRFVKTWCMRNDGTVTFPSGCRLMPVSGDLMAGPEDGVAVEQRAPGEEFHVSATMTTPPLSGRYIGYWRLRTADGQNFGHRIWADVLVTGGTADLVVEGSMDGDWDLVNMQRLSKAVEHTAKDEQNAADDAATAAAASTPTPTSDVTTPDTPMETPVETSGSPVTAAAAPVDTAEPTPETDPALAEAIAAIDAAEVRSPPIDAGSEESKSSDDSKEGGEGGTSVATTKWHRELCSLAEMGFGDTPRNISLLEKHVTTSGGPGMERVLHELLSWHEVSFQ